MENPSCPSTPPETISALLWTTIAVFGIVYALLGEWWGVFVDSITIKVYN